MKLCCSNRGVINNIKPDKDIKQLKGIGYDSVFLDLESFKDEKLSADDVIDRVTKSCKENGMECELIRKPSGDFTMDERILFTNHYRCFNGHLLRGENSDPLETAEKIDNLNQEAGFEKYGFCMDVGVCNICGQNMYDMIKVLGHRIKAVILRDNNGSSDSALLPFTSATVGGSHTDWLNLIRGLREIEFDGTLIMDCQDTFTAISHLLRPQMIEMSFSVAKFFKWQIEMLSVLKKYDTRVLFGAGNMCRNYMKCYGEEFPPLYTCDNNKNIWGTTFAGLEIKNPEELKKLSQDCAIFICNVFYDEIEAQLREMGIMNPIEKFNDEYMPSIYTDRLDPETRQIK